jgi:glycine cleavage system pyridoxal-binding protein P
VAVTEETIVVVIRVAVIIAVIIMQIRKYNNEKNSSSINQYIKTKAYLLIVHLNPLSINIEKSPSSWGISWNIMESMAAIPK